MHPDPEHPSGIGSTAQGSGSDSKRSHRGPLDYKNVLPVAKFTIILVLGVLIAALGLLNPGDILRSRRQFKSWYSQYVYQFSTIARDNCTDAYSVYLYGTRQNTSDATLSGAGKFTLFVQPMINCLLENSSEYTKYQLSASQVVLGLTPTILALLGASSEEVCLLALIGRRRLLGLLLTAASPSIYTERAFRYQDPDAILKKRRYELLEECHVKPSMRSSPRWFFVSLEYIAVLGAVANVATLNWELGMKSVNAVNPNTIYMPMLWSLLGIAAQLAGAVVFNMRARRSDTTLSSPPEARRRKGLRSAISNTFTACKEIASREFCWGTEGPKARLYFELIPESRCFTILAWLLSILIIFHIILGTLILSSTTFVGPKNALGVMARYILSVVICRVILVYELAVLRVEYKNARSAGHLSRSKGDQEV